MSENLPEPPATPAPDDPVAGVPARQGPRRWLAVIPVAVIAVGVLVFSGALPFDGSATVDPTGAPGTERPSPSGTASPTGIATPTASPTASADATGTPAPTASPGPQDPTDYLLMSRADLAALPTSGPAWDAMLAIADASPGEPDLSNQDERHGVNTLAAALVYARTGEARYREHARSAIMDAIGTERTGADNSILALGRQLGAYVLAADFIGLDGTDDERFRRWLRDIRTDELGGHGRWRALSDTHEDSANNWGAFAGASRLAASLYLDDASDVERAARVLRGFLGDRGAWARFQPVEGSADWACNARRYTPINPPCARDGIDLDGAIVRDISRGGNLEWPPGEAGIRYTLEALQGLVLQTELLYQNGHEDAWEWSDAALRRAAALVSASGAAGGDTWNGTEPNRHVPWILNARYGLDLPTRPAGIGRVFGYTDWLYGS
jgi:hypothetical protein